MISNETSKIKELIKLMTKKYFLISISLINDIIKISEIIINSKDTEDFFNNHYLKESENKDLKQDKELNEIKNKNIDNYDTNYNNINYKDRDNKSIDRFKNNNKSKIKTMNDVRYYYTLALKHIYTKFINQEKDNDMFIKRLIMYIFSFFNQILENTNFNEITIIDQNIIGLSYYLHINKIKNKRINWNLYDELDNDAKINYLNRYLIKEIEQETKEKKDYFIFDDSMSVSSRNNKILKNFPDVIIENNQELEQSQRDVDDFVGFFKTRFKEISKILRNRPELSNAISIAKIESKKDYDVVSTIGLVYDIIERNNFKIIQIEDNSGLIDVYIKKDDLNTRNIYDLIIKDEVIGIKGVYRKKQRTKKNNGFKAYKKVNGSIYASQVIIPDIPHTQSETFPNDFHKYAIFISDLHVGSNLFLEKEFNLFLKWINGKTGNEKQKKLAENIRYIFVLGDIVDGVGIYPEQQKELSIKDIYEQYNEAARLLSEIPDDKILIVISGNHDAVRIAEPQPVLDRNFAKEMYKLKNAIYLINPSYVSLNSGAFVDKESKIRVLMYHGYSFDYYVNEIDYLRQNGGYDKIDLTMKFLLQKRHLAPTHSSSLYFPFKNRDPLTISKVPEIFASGHIHKTTLSKYKDVFLISGSCWQSKTPFQEKLGHHPEPGRVPIIDLTNLSSKILKFIN